jgi:sodium/proline symporter
MVAGGGTVVLWGQLEGGIFDLYEILPGFALSLAVLYGLRNREG